MTNFVTTPEFNKFTAEVFDARLEQANLMTKTGFDTKLISFNRKITQIKQNMHSLKMN